jgi:hypothetical protein
MYPSTRFSIIDNSAITTPTITDTSLYQVLQMIGFSSDQGPEKYNIVSGKNFFSLYGSNISFKKHGQPLLQAAMAINSGARLYAKRIVAEDSALANIGVVAVLEKKGDVITLRYQKAVIPDAKGTEYENYKNHATLIKKAFNTSVANVLNNGNEFDDDYYDACIDKTNHTLKVDGPVYFPLFVIAENGRGISYKSIKIIPDFSGSKYYTFIKYQLEIKRDNETLQTVNFALDPDTVYDGTNLSVENAFRSSTQLICKQNADVIKQFINALSAILDIDVDTLNTCDILTLRDTRKQSLNYKKGAKGNTVIYVDNSNYLTYNFDSVGKATSDKTISAAEFDKTGSSTIKFVTGYKSSHTVGADCENVVSVKITKIAGTSYSNAKYADTTAIELDAAATSGNVEEWTANLSDFDTLDVSLAITTQEYQYTKTITVEATSGTVKIDLGEIDSWDANDWSQGTIPEETEDTASTISLLSEEDTAATTKIVTAYKNNDTNIYYVINDDGTTTTAYNADGTKADSAETKSADDVTDEYSYTKSESFSITVETTSDTVSDVTDKTTTEDSTSESTPTTGTGTVEIIDEDSDTTAIKDPESVADHLNMYDNYTITEHMNLGGGSNGTFGDAPINSKTYDARMVKVFDGSYDSEIYDLDNIKIDVIVDANYSHGKEIHGSTVRLNDVKTAIQEFVQFREDCVYFADMGTDVYDLVQVKEEYAKFIPDKFTAIYHNSYNVNDPYTYKEITVTIGYHIAQLLYSHFVNGSSRPFAGQLYGVTLDGVVDGTLNYIPTKRPNDIDEKEELDDLRVNYASYYDGILTVETEYTSQTNYTQFSYINNIILVQDLIKSIRSRCPKIRYTFIDGDDLTFYQQEIQKVIDNIAPSFLSISFEYVEDETYAQNKIFYGAIEVKFRNFVQSEYFKVTAIG